MKRVIVRLANHLSPAGRSGTLGAVTCAAGANVLGGLGQQLNHVIAGTISDCVGAQFLQAVPMLGSVPMLGTMGTGEFNIGSMATQSAAALIGGALLAIFTGLVSRMRLKPTATGAPA
jgi:hypothetical protein